MIGLEADRRQEELGFLGVSEEAADIQGVEFGLGVAPENDFLLKGSDDRERQEAEELAAWRNQSSATIDGHLLDFDKFAPGEQPEVKRGALIRSFMDVHFDRTPETTPGYEVAREQLAGHLFDGEGGGSDEEFFGKLQTRAQEKRDRQEFHQSLVANAISGTLSGGDTSFSTWRASQDGHAGARGGRDHIYLSQWNEAQRVVAEEYGDVLPQVRHMWDIIKDGGAEASIKEIALQLDEEGRDTALQLTSNLVRALPKEQRAEFFSNLGKSTGRSAEGLGRGILNALESIPSARAGEFDSHSVAIKQRAQKGFAASFRRLLEQDYDPIVPLADEDSFWLSAAEQGAYAFPGAAASTALAITPGIGQVAMFGVMENDAFETYYLRFRDAGMSEGDASASASQIAPIVAGPQMAMERLGGKLILGKLPALDKALSKFSDKITNGAIRFGVRTVAGATQETGIENLQDLTLEFGQDIASALDQDLPGANWQEVFDGYAHKSLSTFIAVLPLSIFGAAGGVSQERRNAVFSQASDGELAAAGVRVEDIQAIRGAEGLSSLSLAVTNASVHMDPKSEAAQIAAGDLADAIEIQRELEEDAMRTGALPGVRALPKQAGFEVFDTGSGDVIATTENAEAAVVTMLEHRKMMERTSMARLDQLVSMVEGSQELQATDGDQRETTFELRLDETLTVAQAAEGSPEKFDRMRQQLQTEEKLDGLDGASSVYVFGESKTTGEARQRQTLNKLQAGSTAFTLVHEDAHGWFQESLDQGRLTLDETAEFFRVIDSALDGKKTRSGKGLRFLPDGEATFEQVDEAVAKFAEVMVLDTRDGEKTRFREILNKNVAALAETQGHSAAKNFKAFVRALRQYFEIALTRHLHIKRGIADGTIDRDKIDEFRAKLQGTTDQEVFEGDVAEIAGEFTDPNYAQPSADQQAAGVAFSISNLPPGDYNNIHERHREILPDATRRTKDAGGRTAQGKGGDSGKDPGGTRGRTGEVGEDVGEGAESVVGSLDALRVLKKIKPKGVWTYKRDGGLTRSTDFDDVALKVLAINHLGGMPSSAFEEEGRSFIIQDRGEPITQEEFEAIGELPFNIKPSLGNTYRIDISGDAFLVSDLHKDNFLKDADGEIRVIDLVVGRTDSGNALASANDSSYSLGNSSFIDRLKGDALSRARKPETRIQIMGDVARRLEGMRREHDETVRAFGEDATRRAISDPRKIASLKKEAAMREALRREELEDQVWADYAGYFEDSDLTKLKSQPIHSFLGDPNNPLKGDLMSPSKMKRDAGAIGDQYDGADGVNRTVFGGSRSPDQAAQELYDLNLLHSPTPDALWEALKAEQAGVERGQESLAKGRQALRDANDQAKAETRQWLDGAIEDQKRDHNPLARVRRALATLDAILMALPPELRGKVGGFVQIARLSTDEKRLEFLTKRLEKLDKVVEKWIVGKQKEEIQKLFDRAKIKKTPKGIPQAKLAADFTDEVRRVEAAAALSKTEVDAKIQALQVEIDAETDQDVIDSKTQEMVFLFGFGDIESMGSRQLLTFHSNLLSIVDTGLMLKAALDEAAKIETDRLIEVVDHDVTGGKGRLTSSAAKQREADREQLAGLSKFHRQNISFEWLLNSLSRENLKAGTLKSGTHRELATMVHKATHSEKRQNAETEAEYRDALSSILKVKGLKLSKAIAALSEEIGSTGVMRIDYGAHGKTTKKTARARNIRAIVEGANAKDLGFNKSELASALREYKRIQSESKEGVVKDNRIIAYESENKGVEEQLQLSQGQAINLTMLYRQEGLRASMEQEGYSTQTMKEMEAFLSDEALRIRDWLADQYDLNYDTVNDVFKVQNGVNLPKIQGYSPASRLATGQVKDMSIDSHGGSAMATNPNFVISRVKNFAQMDQRADALSLYMRHSVQTNHYVAWAEPIKKLRTIFGNPQIKENVKAYRGESLLSLINERIEWMADGGNRKAMHLKGLDKLRSAVTFSALAYNAGVAIKQLTSLPAYAFDMSFAEFGRYAGRFAANPKKHVKEMLATDYVKTRFKEGYERDVIEGLRGDGGIVVRALQTGMLFGKAGDIVPVIVGGWMARTRAYDLAILDGKTHAEAEATSILEFEMVTDRAQQAGDLKDLSSYQASGSIAKLFTMFKTSPRQYYSNVYESALDAKAGKTGSRKEFARRLFIGQLVLPLIFQFASDALRAPFNDDDEEDFSPLDYVRAALLGPLNGLFIAGDFAELMTSGVANVDIWAEELPIFSGGGRIAYGLHDLWDGDFWEGVDSVARGVGKLTPGPLTFWEILRRESRKLGIAE